MKLSVAPFFFKLNSLVARLAIRNRGNAQKLDRGCVHYATYVRKRLRVPQNSFSSFFRSLGCPVVLGASFRSQFPHVTLC